MVDMKRREKPTITWDSDDWKVAMRMADGITDDDISDMDTDVLLKMVEDGSIDSDKLSQDPKKQRAFNTKLTDSLGSVDLWDSKKLEKLGGDIIKTLCLEDIAKLDPSAVRRDIIISKLFRALFI